MRNSILTDNRNEFSVSSIGSKFKNGVEAAKRKLLRSEPILILSGIHVLERSGIDSEGT